MTPIRMTCMTRAALFLLTAGCFAGAASAQAAPAAPGFVASPGIYKVIAENDQYRVIKVVWKPGERDVAHSHPSSGVYYLNDCTLRNTLPDGRSMVGEPKAGTARVQMPIASHTIENIGSAPCELVMFEPK